MSRYNSNNTGSSSQSNDNDYGDSTTLKLQQYAAVRLEPTGLGASEHDQYGTSFITNFEGTEIIDGIVFQREDKPATWKVFSADKFFELNPEDGLVYEDYNDGEYSGEMSAQDILDHPRVAGFSETFGGTDYFYEPVGAIVEAAGDIAVNDELDVETTDEPAIEVGDASMLLSNNSWVRTLAKKMTEAGDAAIRDTGETGEDNDNPKYDTHLWLAPDEPELREELEGRTLELWVTEETAEFEDGESVTYEVPNLLDVETDEFVTIDNDESDDAEDDDTEAEPEKATATDGGTAAESGSTESETESPDEPSADDGDGSTGLPEDVPEELDDLLDYMARKGDDHSADDIRQFAEDEVEDADSIDWEAAAEEANERAE